MMKKLLLLLTVAIAMLALPLAAHADKTKWTNPNYDFNKLHRINLVSISVVDPVGSNFTDFTNFKSRHKDHLNYS